MLVIKHTTHGWILYSLLSGVVGLGSTLSMLRERDRERVCVCVCVCVLHPSMCIIYESYYYGAVVHVHNGIDSC